MIYSLSGKLIKKDSVFFVIECGGIGYKLNTNKNTIFKLPKENEEVFAFCFLYVRDEQMELYGFLDEETRKLFELLKTVNGVGPKTALGILDVDTVQNITAAIIERRADLLSRAPGIGKKTGERIVLELHTKIKLSEGVGETKSAGRDKDIEDVLVDLGYPRYKVRDIIQSLPQDKEQTIEDRLKHALKELGK